ncbi:hypothetical protein B0H63DRAFT_497069 [Podospora didyma]|uniref:HNH nuclease domain-containing protein n=1 Tax=Podospora didyma TaxID=330526 RepID=A0AAE0N6K7_9PEZI|nr:hypothetical protein B0H63DRAFT_497069 [Podospora didyma]
MDPVPPSPPHRHQASLEDIIFLSEEPEALDAVQRSRAEQKFHRIVRHFEAAEDGTRSSSNNSNRNSTSSQYNAHCLSASPMNTRARGNRRKLSCELSSIQWPSRWTAKTTSTLSAIQEHLRAALLLFADYLFDNFFLPLHTSSGKTPQLPPLVHSAILRAQGGETRNPRGECLIRDQHHCVISRQFDLEEAKKRFEADDGDPLMTADSKFAHLEVAHILPHSLTKPPSKKAALDILNMFDKGVLRYNFKPVPGHGARTYQIRSFLPLFMQDLPVVRTFFLTESRTIEPPSARFLALHHAIAHILHLSGAGDYIRKILRDMEWKDTREDISTELSHLVAIKLGEWPNAVRT